MSTRCSGSASEAAGVSLRYEHLAEHATELEIDGLRILVASLDDIIRSKEVVDRPKDREALEELRTLRDSGDRE